MALPKRSYSPKMKPTFRKSGSSSFGYGVLLDGAAPRMTLQKKVLIGTVSAFCLYFFFLRGSTSTPLGNGSGKSGYIVVIDAGSSGSRAHVFNHKNGVVDPKHESLKSKPGLSSYADKPTEAGASLQPLLEFAKKHIPATSIPNTPIILKATAGMRLLPEAKRTAVMANVKTFLKSSQFQFQSSEVISGSEEGSLGWLAVNYLNDMPKDSLWGVLEMGGASVQVSLPLSQESHPEVPADLKRPYQDPSDKKQGQVFTHSFLGLGMESARQAVNNVLQDQPHDPCLQTGYLPDGPKTFMSGVDSAIPQGDFDKCLALVVNAIYPKSECSHSTCFYNGLYKPHHIPTNLWGFENFFYQPSGVGMKGVPGKVQIADLATKAKEVCALPWAQLKAGFPKDDQPADLNEVWCFGMTHTYAFLTKGLGLDPSQQITVGNSVYGNGIDWALGAALQAVEA